MSTEEERYDEYSKRFNELLRASIERECPLTPRQQVDMLKNLLKDAEEEIEHVAEDYQDIGQALMTQCAKNNTIAAESLTYRDIILGLCGGSISKEKAVEALNNNSTVERQAEDIKRMHAIVNELAWLQGCAEAMNKLREDKSTDACEEFINEQKDFDQSLEKLFGLVSDLLKFRDSKG